MFDGIALWDVLCSKQSGQKTLPPPRSFRGSAATRMITLRQRIHRHHATVLTRRPRVIGIALASVGFNEFP